MLERNLEQARTELSRAGKLDPVSFVFAVRVAFCLILAATTACSQSLDISQRLRQACASTSAGELAALELSKKNYARVDEMLAGAGGANDAARTELLSLRGAVAFLAGNMTAALLHFEEASRLAPLKQEDAFTEAMALVKTGDIARGRRVLSELSEKHPQRPLYLYWLGRLDYGQRRYDEAVQKLQKAIELDPKSARAWDSLGLAFDMQGQVEQAHTAFEKAVNLNREQARPSPWPPHDLGSWLLRVGRAPEAETALRESLRYDPALAQTNYHLGRALEKEGRDGEATEEYRTAIANDRTATDAPYSLAMLYRKLHRQAEANAMFAEYRKRKEEHRDRLPDR